MLSSVVSAIGASRSLYTTKTAFLMCSMRTSCLLNCPKLINSCLRRLASLHWDVPKIWHTAEGYPYELCTMPGFAGSSAYYLRYMDPRNNNALVSKEADEYWRNVDLYIGGTEHATGHLIYSRFWNKFLFDNGVVCEEEPFKKLINQGMIQGRSNFVYRIKDTNTFVSYGLKKDYDTTPIHVDVNIVSNDVLDIEKFKGVASGVCPTHSLCLRMANMFVDMPLRRCQSQCSML